jgi:hypothetical protein
MPLIYPNQWACRFLDPWDFVDAKNPLEKRNIPPPRVGHYNFLSHLINTSMTIFIIWLKYWVQATRSLVDMIVYLGERGVHMVKLVIKNHPNMISDMPNTYMNYHVKNCQIH